MGRIRLNVAGIWRGILVVLVGIAISQSAAAQSPPTLAAFTRPSSSTPLNTTFVDWDALAVRQIGAGLSRPIFDNPAPGLEKLEMHSTTLNPGTTLHAPHHHAWEELCFVKEGEVQITLNGRNHRAGAGFLIFFASHDAHSIENASDKPATYFVINIVSPSARTTPHKPAAEQNAPGKLPSSVFDCESLPKSPDGIGASALICNSPTLTFSKLMSQITLLAAGTSARLETTEAENQLVFVKEGLVEVALDKVSSRMRAGAFFYCQPRTKVVLKNVGTEQAKYQIIQFASGH